MLAGLRGVPRDVIEAAQGMGLTRRQILRRVELPLALPAIMAGLRIAAVTTISLATIAAYIAPAGSASRSSTGSRRGFRTEFVTAGVLADRARARRRRPARAGAAGAHALGAASA